MGLNVFAGRFAQTDSIRCKRPHSDGTMVSVGNRQLLAQAILAINNLHIIKIRYFI